MEYIPEWAKKRACELANAELGPGGFPYKPMDVATHNPPIWALARYIAAHEQPPVDPLLVEARTMFALYCDWLDPEQVKAGSHDCDWVQAALVTALKRGMELAGERSK